MRRPTYESFDVEEAVTAPAFHAKLTAYVFLTCVVAASGGILFGELRTSNAVLLRQPTSLNPAD